MSIFFSRAELSQASTIDEQLNRAAARLQSLMQTLSGKDFASVEIDKLRTTIESLPPASAEFRLASSYLRKAQRYLRSDEVGAALYELRLLLGCLQCC